MRGHGDRHVGIGDEGGKIYRFEFGARRLDQRQLEMTVGPRTAMPWNMFDDGRDATREHSQSRGAPETRNSFGVATIGAIADDIMRAFRRRVEHGHAVDRYSRLRADHEP